MKKPLKWLFRGMVNGKVFISNKRSYPEESECRVESRSKLDMGGVREV